MKGLTYFAAVMALFAAMIFAQSSTSAPGGQSNSNNSVAQSPSQTNNATPRHASRDTNGARMHDHHAGAPDMTGRTPSANEPRSTAPPPDQQPNFPTRPTQSQAYLTQTPAARAVATHTPDPGTCMNPAALQATDSGSQPRPGPPCD